MLKAIHRVPCSPALQACQQLMWKFVSWLCDPAVKAAGITEAHCVPPRIPSEIEGAWLWNFLTYEQGGRPLLERAQTVAGLPKADKKRLLAWAQTVSSLAKQFQPPPPAVWPTKPPIAAPAWSAFQTLMLAFYAKGLRSGLPYLPDGTPTPSGGVSYKRFVAEFRDKHRLDPHPDAREVCVFCGGPLDSPAVDHWVAEGLFPLLAVCADNLVPICGECNSPANKGQKAVHTEGSFDDWFHPYLRHPKGAIRLEHDPLRLSVTVSAASPEDDARVTKVSGLLNLPERWTREFKAGYRDQLAKLRQRRHQGRGPHSLAELQALLNEYHHNLVPTEPHYEVHQELARAMLDPKRLAIWKSEFNL